MTVDVTEFPAETVGLVAATVNDLAELDTVKVSVPVEVA